MGDARQSMLRPAIQEAEALAEAIWDLPQTIR
jgi:hypothetical protein